MAPVLSLGSINADFVVRTSSSLAGPGSLLATRLLRTSGGKGANVAVLAARLERDAVLLGCVGDDDLAAQAQRGPEAAGVDVSHVRRRPGHTGYSSIVVPPDGAKTIVLATGANDAWGEEVDDVADLVRAAPEGSVLVADLEVPPALVEAALRAAKERGFVTVLDPAPTSRLDDSVLPLVDHLTPDHAEAAELTGTDTTVVAGAREAAERLRVRGAATVHVKLVHGGCVTASPAGTLVVDAPDGVAVVDTTGAGDAFAGALAVALLDGRRLGAAVELAVAAATCAVTALGSQESYPTRAELDAMVGRVRSRPRQSRAGSGRPVVRRDLA